MLESREQTQAPPPEQIVLCPARFERIRLALARDIYCRRLVMHKLVFRLVPDDHPWMHVVGQAHSDLRDLTHATLRPRTGSEIEATIEPRSKHSWSGAVWAMLSVYTVYAVLESTIRRIPGPIGESTGSDDFFRLFERLSSLL